MTAGDETTGVASGGVYGSDDEHPVNAARAATAAAQATIRAFKRISTASIRIPAIS